LNVLVCAHAERKNKLCRDAEIDAASHVTLIVTVPYITILATVTVTLTVTVLLVTILATFIVSVANTRDVKQH